MNKYFCNFLNSLVTLFFILSFFSCKKETNVPDNEVVISDDSSGTSAVFIINEGNFQWGNSSITLYDPESGVLTQNVFEKVNSRPLGDVAQSMTIFNNKAYIVVDNSSKIEVVNLENFSSVGTISDIPSPRYFLGISNSKAYVSNIWSNKVSVVDLNSNAVIKSIPLKGWTEEMFLINDKAFVTNVYSNYLYVINTLTDQLTDSIKISYGSNSLCLDKNEKLWVFCGGDDQKNIFSGLHRINPKTLSVELSFSFESAGGKRIKIDKKGETLYYLKKGIYRFNIEDTVLPSSPLIPENGEFWGWGLDKKEEIIYVADAIDYVQRGNIFRYSITGESLGFFKAGIIPGEFCFK